MRLLTTFALTAASMATLMLGSTPAAAAALPKSGQELGMPGSALVDRRGVIEDLIVGIIKARQGAGVAFCSDYLRQPAFAATKTVTLTQTVATTVPAATVTNTAFLTSTAPDVTHVDATTVVVAVTPTSEVIVSTAVPFTSTVATVTSVTEVTSTVSTVTVTSLTPEARAEPKATTTPAPALPPWLDQFLGPQVSRVCSQISPPKTKTVTQTITSMSTVTAGTASVGVTSTVAVTPTQTVQTVITSTSTADAVTSTVLVPSSSLVPATATVDATSVIAVTATATVYAAPPTETGRLRLIKKRTGEHFGYVKRDYDRPQLLITQDRAAGLVVVAARAPPSLGPINLKIEDAAAPFPFVGVRLEARDRLGPGLATQGKLTPVPSVPAGQFLPKEKEEYWERDEIDESRVWTLDPVTNALTMVWTNTNGVTAQTTIATFASTHLFMTGDYAALMRAQQYPSFWEELGLEFEPIA